MKSLCAWTTAAALFLAACSPSPQKAIVGTWQEADGARNTVEFFEDGTFRLKLTNGEMGALENLSGKWLILQDGRIKLDFSMLGIAQSVVGTLEFDGKDMIITDDNGRATRHHRLR